MRNLNPINAIIFGIILILAGIGAILFIPFVG